MLVRRERRRLDFALFLEQYLHASFRFLEFLRQRGQGKPLSKSSRERSSGRSPRSSSFTTLSSSSMPDSKVASALLGLRLVRHCSILAGVAGGRVASGDGRDAGFEGDGQEPPGGHAEAPGDLLHEAVGFHEGWM